MTWIVNNFANIQQGNINAAKNPCTYCLWSRPSRDAPWDLIYNGCTSTDCDGCQTIPEGDLETDLFAATACNGEIDKGNIRPNFPGGASGKCLGCWWKWDGQDGYVKIDPPALLGGFANNLGQGFARFGCPSDRDGNFTCGNCPPPSSTEWLTNNKRYVYTLCDQNYTTTTPGPYDQQIPSDDCRTGCEWDSVSDGNGGYTFTIRGDYCRAETQGEPKYCEPSCSGCVNPVTWYDPTDPALLNILIYYNQLYPFQNPILTGCEAAADPYDPVVPEPSPGCSGICTCTWTIEPGYDSSNPYFWDVGGITSLGFWDCISSCEVGCECPNIPKCKGRFFGDVTLQPCQLQVSTTTTSTTSTTTTPCVECCDICVWGWYFGYWAEKLQDGCGEGCECPTPPYDGNWISTPRPINPGYIPYDIPNGSYAYSNCVKITTTSTTTTTTPVPLSTTISPENTSTTTTSNVPCGTCDWVWAAPGAWTQTGYCENLACSCSQPGYAGTSYGEVSVTSCS